MKLFGTSDDTTAEDETAQDENAATAMSQETAQPADDEQPAVTGPVSDSEYDAAPATAYQDPGTPSYQDGTPSYADDGASTDQPQPTFTPATAETTETADDTSVTAVDTPATSVRASGATVVNEAPGVYEPATAFAADESEVASPAAPASPYQPTAASPAAPASPAYETAAAVPADELPMDEPVAAFTANEPLLANTTGMRASWQKVQSEFVDDPKAAVMDAADLIEQTAQSLVDALQQRQQQLRGDASVTSGSAGSDSTGSSGVPDTEQLRLMMQRYRTLFDQLCNA
jgi:hypothetical protein